MSSKPWSSPGKRYNPLHAADYTRLRYMDSTQLKPCTSRTLCMATVHMTT